MANKNRLIRWSEGNRVIEAHTHTQPHNKMNDIRITNTMFVLTIIKQIARMQHTEPYRNTRFHTTQQKLSIPFAYALKQQQLE